MKFTRRLAVLLVFIIFTVFSAQGVLGAAYHPSTKRYHRLTEAEQYVYDEMLKTLNVDNIGSNNTVSLTIKTTPSLDISNSELWDTMFALIDDNPSLYWISQNRVSGTVTQNKKTDTTTINYTFNAIGTKEEINEYKEKINSIINYVKTQTAALSTTEAKVSYIHNYVCGKADYASDELKDRYALKNRAAWTAVGCLIKGKATCAGYAGAFNLLCSNCGITSVTQGCTSVYGASHAFNLVKMDNSKWYAVDCTWDGSSSAVKKTYYLMGKDTVDSYYKDLYDTGITINKTGYF
ncbi:MAG: hypothetical protein LIO44_00930, partial [Eubacterium sp.]|nr:hypothetical protein [Eubacterium sp.]